MKPEQRYIELGQTVLEEARRAVFLEAFGDALAQKEGLQNVDGIQAIHLYLMKKHHWQLSYIRTLSKAYLADLLNQEMQGFDLTSGHPAVLALAQIGS